MDFSWTDEQQEVRQDAIAFAEQHLNDDLIARNRAGEWSCEAGRKCADYGLLGLVVPEEYGGSATDIMTAVLVMEGIGYGCRENGLPCRLGSVQPVRACYDLRAARVRNRWCLNRGVVPAQFSARVSDNACPRVRVLARVSCR